MVIPNRKIVGEILHNYGKIRQVSLMVGVGYETDLNKALATIHEILQNNPKILRDPLPAIAVSTLADSSINISVNPWVDVADFGPTTGELYKAIVESFRAGGISIPFPQHEVRLIGNAA